VGEQVTQYVNISKGHYVHIVKDVGTAYLLQIHKSDEAGKVGTRIVCPKVEFDKWYKEAGNYKKVA
jgi:hypothetical protein